MIIIISDFLMFYQIFLSPQVKGCTIISNKHGIYKLPHELANESRLKMSGNQKMSGKSQNFIELQPGAQFSSQNERFVNTSKNFLNTKTAVRSILSPLWFFEKCIFQRKVITWFFVTFNFIIRHIFPENFLEIPQVVRKIFQIFQHLPVTKKLMM